MTNETAVIISALITTSGALIGVVITMIITHRREIKEECGGGYKQISV